MLIENDKNKIIQLMNELFCGMHFDSFKFSSTFTLSFSRENLKRNSPLNMNLYLENWWFGAKEDWHGQLSLLRDQEAQYLEEALQASELTSLKCSEGAEIYSFLFKKEVLEIGFTSGHQLNISCAPMMGSNWMLVGTPCHDADPGRSLWSVNVADWSFTCEGGEYFARIPEQNR